MNKSIYRFYVGANNETKRLELELLKTYLNSRVSGYTLSLAKELYEGTEEESAIVDVAYISLAESRKLAHELCRLLKQQSIMVAEAARQAEFIGA